MCPSSGRGVCTPTATHSLVTLEETQGTATRSCLVQSTALPQHRHCSGKSSSPVGKQRECTEERARGAVPSRGDPQGIPNPWRTAYSRHRPRLPLPPCFSSQPACCPGSAASHCHPLQGRAQGPRQTSVQSQTPAALGQAWDVAPQLYQGRSEVHPALQHISKHSHNKIFFISSIPPSLL